MGAEGAHMAGKNGWTASMFFHEVPRQVFGGIIRVVPALRAGEPERTAAVVCDAGFPGRLLRWRPHAGLLPLLCYLLWPILILALHSWGLNYSFPEVEPSVPASILLADLPFSVAR